MKKVIMFLSIMLLIIACNSEKDAIDKGSKEQLQTIAIDIQKEFAHMNMKMGDIDEDKILQMNEKIAFLSQEIKELREGLPKDEVSVDILQSSHKLYEEMLLIYQEAGFNTDNVEKKIKKLENGLDDL